MFSNLKYLNIYIEYFWTHHLGYASEWIKTRVTRASVARSFQINPDGIVFIATLVLLTRSKRNTLIHTIVLFQKTISIIESGHFILSYTIRYSATSLRGWGNHKLTVFDNIKLRREELFCRHYIAGLPFLMENFWVFNFYHTSMQSESLNFTRDIPRHWVISVMGKKIMECKHTLRCQGNVSFQDYSFKTGRYFRYST